MLQCCLDDAPDVRQSAFALLGDLARVSLCVTFELTHFICIRLCVSFINTGPNRVSVVISVGKTEWLGNAVFLFIANILLLVCI